MNSQNYFALMDDGNVFRVQLTASPIQINEDLLRTSLKDAVGSVIRNLVSAAIISPLLRGNIGLASTPTRSVAWSRIGLMPMNVRTSTKGGFVYPEFGSKEGPVVALQWRPPESMRLYFVTTVDIISNAVVDNLLVAMDKSGAFWRLPITNVFANCQVCTGEFNRQGSTVMDCVGRSWQQFASSPYNEHLVNDGGKGTVELGKELFKFKPLEKEGFESVDYEGEWTKLCTKIGNEFLLTHMAI